MTVPALPPLQFSSSAGPSGASSDGWMSDHSGFAVSYGSGNAGAGTSATGLPFGMTWEQLGMVVLVGVVLWRKLRKN